MRVACVSFLVTFYLLIPLCSMLDEHILIQNLIPPARLMRRSMFTILQSYSRATFTNNTRERLWKMVTVESTMFMCSGILSHPMNHTSSGNRDVVDLHQTVLLDLQIL